MEGEELKQGKARVYRVLLEPLKERGMARPARMTVAAEQDMMDRLAARLAYMAEDRLQALAEVVEAHGGGKLRNTWPAEVSICNWARRIQQPPAGVSRLVRTMLQSAAGDAAEAGGYLVELFRFLRKHGTPPGDNYGYNLIQSEASENQSRRARILREQQKGIASTGDLDWLRHYMQDRIRAQDIRKAKGGAA